MGNKRNIYKDLGLLDKKSQCNNIKNTCPLIEQAPHCIFNYLLVSTITSKIKGYPHIK